MLLMPSQYEPCGLNQLYSLRYGAIPVVRATGGLADTVVDAQENTLLAGTATGFAFTEYTSIALAAALERACRAYADPVTWSQLIETGMRQDWSWQRSAKAYLDLYEKALTQAPQHAGA
jgi:starch synthase